jgi:hypothetical protein
VVSVDGGIQKLAALKNWEIRTLTHTIVWLCPGMPSPTRDREL